MGVYICLWLKIFMNIHWSEISKQNFFDKDPGKHITIFSFLKVPLGLQQSLANVHVAPSRATDQGPSQII